MSFEELWGIGVSREELERVDRKKEGTDTKGMINCASCGTLFKPKRSNQKYCNGICRDREIRKRRTLRRKLK